MCWKRTHEEPFRGRIVDGHLTVDDARRSLVDAGWLDG